MNCVDIHNELLLSVQHLSIFLPRHSTTACNSLLCHSSLCFIGLFFFTGGHLSSLSPPLDTLSSKSCLTSLKDMKSTFSTSSYFHLASSIIVELYDAFSLAFAFYRKKVVTYMNIFLLACCPFLDLKYILTAPIKNSNWIVTQHTYLRNLCLMVITSKLDPL